VDTDSFENHAFFSVYPNPVKENTITITFKDSLNGYVNARLYSIQGTQIFNKAYRVNGNLLKFSPDRIITPGIYILELEFNNYKFHKKVIVSR
jgi:hypothetical protein